MDINNLGHRLKNLLSENKLNQKNVKASIDHSLTGSAEQKSLSMNLEKESEKPRSEKKLQSKNSKKKEEKKRGLELIEKEEKYIERDPMKLLKIF